MYLDKVFDFSSRVAALPEGRQFPQHPWKKIFDAIFLGAAMQWPSLLQIQDECRTGALAQRIGSISDDTFGYAMQRQSPEPIFNLGCDIARRLKRNGVLLSDWSRGLVIAAVDGIEICSSYCRCCDDCLQREVQRTDGSIERTRRANPFGRKRSRPAPAWFHARAGRGARNPANHAVCDIIGSKRVQVCARPGDEAEEGAAVQRGGSAPAIRSSGGASMKQFCRRKPILTSRAGYRPARPAGHAKEARQSGR
jgi:hypothetical protein